MMSLNVKNRLKAVIGACVLLGLPIYALGDVAHFRNGKNIRGKLTAMTGDIIEFKTRGLSGQDTLKRLALNSRSDVVETWSHRLYFGELVYVDAFKMEIKTSTGTVKINRLMVKNVILGSPSVQGHEQNQAGQTLSEPVLPTPSAKYPVEPLPEVDQD